MRRTLLVLVAVVAVVGWEPREGFAGSSGEAGEETLVLRPARRPSKVRLHLMERWIETWRSRGGPLERAVDALDPEGRGAPRMERRVCLDLAGALLELDRGTVLPAPDAAVSFHVERGLRRLTRTAITCITRRPYAARRALEEARGSFTQAARLLERYEVGPGNLGGLAR